MPVLKDLRHQLVALDEHTALVVGGEVHRSEDPVAAALAQPPLGGVEQRRGHRGVALALEEPEQTPAVVLEVVETVVDVGADPPDRLAVEPGDEVLGLRVLKERIARPIEMPPALGQEGGHPVRGAAIDRPRKPDEGAELAPVRDRSYVDPSARSPSTSLCAADRL